MQDLLLIAQLTLLSWVMTSVVLAFCFRSVDTQSDAPVSNCTFIHHAVNSLFAMQ